MMLHLIGENTAENDKRKRDVERMRRRMSGEHNIFRVMSIDIGAVVDYSAVTILERTGDMNQIRHLERIPLGTDYLTQIERFQMLARYSHIDRVVVDQTGVGAPIVQLLQKSGLKPIGIMITGGNDPVFNGSSWHIPKRDLITAALVAFQNRQIKIADVPERKALLDELQAFEIKISQSGHDSYAAAGTGHDDLVLSVAMAVYAANRLYHTTNLNMDDAQGFGSLTPEPEELSLSEIHRRAMNDYHRMRR